MKDRQPLGDIPAEEFRKQLHELADWIADYREHIGERRISPNDEPGAILAQLNATAPETAAPLNEICALGPSAVHELLRLHDNESWHSC